MALSYSGKLVALIFLEMSQQVLANLVRAGAVEPGVCLGEGLGFGSDGRRGQAD